MAAISRAARALVPFLLAVAASGAPLAARGQDWPQFRGPNGDGIASTGRHPREWNETTNVAWKVPISGRGWSQPVIAGDRIFLTTAVATEEEKPRRGESRGIIADAQDQREIAYQWKVLCLSAKTGALLWEQTAYEGKPGIRKHRNNTYASETPVTDGERIIAYFGMKGVTCYDVTGKLLWSRNIGEFPMQAGWGTGSSPLLHGNAVFIQCDNEQESFVVALDKRNGEDIWRTPRDDKSNWSTPYLWKNKLRTELVLAGGTKSRSYDPADGKLLWEIAGSGRTSVTPVGDDELVYVDSVERIMGSPGRLTAIRAGASGEFKIGAQDNAGPLTPWSANLNSWRNASPLVYEGCLYTLEQNHGIIRCFNALNGRPHYQQRVPQAAGFTASPWANDGRIYCLDEAGQTVVFEPGPQFKLIGTNRLEGEMFCASPAFAGDRLYLRSMDHLYCIAADGKNDRPPTVAPARPAAPPGNAALASFVAHDRGGAFVLFSPDGKQLISGGGDNLVQIWSLRTGEAERTLQGHAHSIRSGALFPKEDRLVTGSWDQTVRVWDLDSGKSQQPLRGHTDAVHSVAVSPDGKTIASGGADGVFRLWNASSLELLFTSAAQELHVNRVAFSPAGKILATGTGKATEWRRAGEVKLWDAGAGGELATLPGHTACVNTLVFSPDGKRLVTATAEGWLRVWDIEKRELLSATNVGFGVRTAVFLADRETLALGQWPGRVLLWDIAAGRSGLRFTGHDKPDAMVDSIAVGPDGSLLATTGTDGMIYLWAVPEMSPDGKRRLWPQPSADTPTSADLVRKWKPAIRDGAKAGK
ncbi:MAG: PQQ-binding-like beta-propeller repeat protein [Deltaproteobacteria bacterium]